MNESYTREGYESEKVAQNSSGLEREWEHESGKDVTAHRFFYILDPCSSSGFKVGKFNVIVYFNNVLKTCYLCR